MSRYARWLFVAVCLWVCPAVAPSVAEQVPTQALTTAPVTSALKDPLTGDEVTAPVVPSATNPEVSPPQTATNSPEQPEWTRDVWHYVTQASPFYTEERSSLHSAGVIQADGRFALLVLGTPDQGALVSVNLPGDTAQTALTSDLVLTSGGVLSRSVTHEQLVANVTLDGASHTYSFRIAPADVETFMAARHWRITAGDTRVTLTLKGSRRAISKAIAARDTPVETSAATPQE